MHKHMTDIQTNQQCRKGQTHPNRSGKNGNSCKEEQKRKVHRVSRKPKRTLTKNFYSGFGFEIVGRRPRYYLDNREDALIMTLADMDKKIERLVGTFQAQTSGNKDSAG